MTRWTHVTAAAMLGLLALGGALAAETSADDAAIRELKETLWPKAYFEQDTALTFEIRRLDVFENGTAIAAGTGTIRGKDEYGPYVGQYQSTNVLIKRDGQWRAVASHVSGYKKVE
jgi:ketosteroid isomerase-like protein